ncbi:hypothetical protein B0T20DRAFT_86409 [Sordaria brevicollis]|uniref:Rhodopsin domain-containing protein n=1 Tax=Sordaria brevicollis TaxID=83679 RepID=A0AAE0U329_SORBR|nr:hypothetical protein B0T20DRAFT_86409 [Sordaria brevicollis]
MSVFVAPSTNPQGAALLAIFWTLQAICTVFVGLRLYCKIIRGRNLWWDDHLLIISYVLLCISTCVVTATALLGYGLQTRDVPLPNWQYLGILGAVTGTTSVLHAMLSKVSFAVTLLRLTDGWIKRFIWFIIITLSVGQVSSAFMFWLRCLPAEATWNPHIEDKKCWDSKAFLAYSIAGGIYAALVDIVLAFLPWPILLRFHMYRGEKVGVAIAMSMGVFAGIAGFIKVSTISRMESDNWNYDGFPLVVWGFAEGACTIVAASIPTLRALFIHAFKTPERPSIDIVVDSNRSAGASARHARSDWNERKHDNRSEQSILAIPPASSSTMDRSIETDIERDAARPLNNRFEMKHWQLGNG